MIEIRDLRIGDIIGVRMNARFVAEEVTALNIEEKPGTPLEDVRPGKVKIMFLPEFRKREYPDMGCEIYQAWIDDNPDKYRVVTRDEALSELEKI